MNLYFDTEFTGLKKNTNLISVGIVAETGDKFYAENIDILSEVIIYIDPWIKKNVIDRTIMGGDRELESSLLDDSTITTVIRGMSDIKNQLSKWLRQFSDVQFISDVCHYDFVLLIDIFGTAFDLPMNVSPTCYDINQDIAKFYGITQRQAFDKSREDIIKELYGGDIIKGNKHNSLYDAEVIKAIYNGIHKQWR